MVVDIEPEIEDAVEAFAEEPQVNCCLHFFNVVWALLFPIPALAEASPWRKKKAKKFSPAPVTGPEIDAIQAGIDLSEIWRYAQANDTQVCNLPYRTVR